MYSYSGDFSPPAPVLPLECSSPVSRSAVDVVACIDSGADVTVVPRTIVSQLGLRRTEITMAAGFDGPPAEYPLFSVLIRIPGKEPVYARAIAWNGDYALLGRDVINGWELVLDGPGGTLTVS